MPIIVDKRNDKAVQDSWEIAKYLEEAYPDHPSVFNGNQGVHKFFHDYCDQNVMVPVFKMCLISLYNSCGEFKDYFRTDREITFKMTLEELAGQAEDHIPALKEGLLPIHQLLQTYPYITGDQGSFLKKGGGLKKVYVAYHFYLFIFSWLGRHCTCFPLYFHV